MTEGVSVIVLVERECENIERVVARCMATLTVPTEIIIVASKSVVSHNGDNSRRFSAERDRTKSCKTPSTTVSVIRQNTDETRAETVVGAFQRARHDYWVVIDANRQYPPEKLPVLVRALTEGADIAIARRSNDGRIDFGKRAAFTLTKLGLDIPSSLSRTEITSGFFAVRRDAVELEEIDPWGNMVLLDLFVKDNIEYINDVRMKTDEREENGFSWTESQTVVEQVLALLFVRLGMDRVIAPVRAVRATEYAFIGGIGTVINMLVFGGIHLGLGIHYLFAGALAFTVALNWNFMGNWALTFDRPNDGLWDKYSKFIAVSLVGFVLYTGLLAISISYLRLPVLLSNGIAITGSATFNFLGSEIFAFSMRSLD